MASSIENTENYWIKKSFETDVPSWSEILENLNWSVENKMPLTHFPLGFFASLDAYRIEKVKPVLERLSLIAAHLYINVATDASGFGMHHDHVDVFYWQVQGKSRWEIDCGPTWELEPGDLVFIRTGIGHRSTALTPRAGISMSI